MKPFSSVEGKAYPLGLANIDTDVIIPSRFLKALTRDGLGVGAFETLRKDGASVFDDPSFAGAPILIAGENFGCGSSREHAVWALSELGIKAIVAPSFSDIFFDNAVKNGILPVALPHDAVTRLLTVAQEFVPMAVDLEHMMITTHKQDRFPFDMNSFQRDCLLGGLDAIDITLSMSSHIDRLETSGAAGRPWHRHEERPAS